MQDFSLDNRGVRSIAVALAATLVALLTVLVLAKPSGAQDPILTDPILTIGTTSVDFGSVTVGGDPATQEITVTNNGLIDLELGGLQILGPDGVEVVAFSTDLGPDGLTVEAGQTRVFTVSFDPLETGLQTAQLTFNSVTDTTPAGNAVPGAVVPAVSLTGQGVSTNPAGSGCTITGGNNSETLRGTPRKDVICALGGNDRVNGLGRNDILKGGPGNDRITDKRGKDRLVGQGGKDVLRSRDGQRGDVLKGGPGRDRAIKDRGDRARSI